MLPRSLLGRSIMIIVTPVVLLQVVVGLGVLRQPLEHGDAPPGAERRRRHRRRHPVDAASRSARSAPGAASASPIHHAGSNFDFEPGEILPNDPTIMRQNLVDRQLSDALESAGRAGPSSSTAARCRTRSRSTCNCRRACCRRWRSASGCSPPPPTCSSCGWSAPRWCCSRHGDAVHAQPGAADQAPGASRR